MGLSGLIRTPLIHDRNLLELVWLMLADWVFFGTLCCSYGTGSLERSAFSWFAAQAGRFDINFCLLSLGYRICNDVFMVV
jgi:hypothetical protein